MKVLIIGSGAREHALAWKLASTVRVKEVYVAPGNAGTQAEDKVKNIHISSESINELIAFCQQKAIDLTLVGPEAPLAAGIVDQFIAAGLKIFGPTRDAARLESSKHFAKEFMQRHKIPTVHFAVFNQVEEAKKYVYDKGVPIVIKADGLAGGKGVVVAENIPIAEQAIEQLLEGKHQKILIEDYLEGIEMSFISIADGEHILPLATSHDYKRLHNHNRGPNTGGMGAYSPSYLMDDVLLHKIMSQIVEPTIQGMKAEGHTFQGFLYAGLMIDQHGNPRVIEFNCRLGDPETQAILLRLEGDLSEALLAACEQRLHKIKLEWSDKSAVAVVLAAQNYPQHPKKGNYISGLDKAGDIAKVFHAGTRETEEGIVTCGGRVLCVAALDEDMILARARAYQAVEVIHFDGMQYRDDIAAKK